MPAIQLNFLGAAIPLTKTFYPDGTKDSYPMVKNFTSYTEPVDTLKDFHTALVKHSKANHCLLKGKLSRNLNDESRANSTRTDDNTRWVCLDFDRHTTPDIDETLKKLGLGEISYIIQYSASHGLPDNMGTVSAHVFMILDKEVPAPMLKAWLMGLNLSTLRHDMRLSRSKTQISWPLDITTCQNDKLLYIAPPVFKAPLKDPLRTRIKLVERKKPTLPITLIGEPNINVAKEQARKELNRHRAAEGLPARTAKTTWVGDKEIHNKPDICSVTGINDAGDWVRLNINGGDSWAYAHSKANPELLYDFKSDAWYRTKEIVPGYYKELVAERTEERATPSQDGDLILAFCDLKSAEYYRGTWNPDQAHLELYKARDRSQLDDWWKSFGRVPPDFVESWDITYDPEDEWIVDQEAHRINTFRPTDYMHVGPNKQIVPNKDFPNIYHMIRHFLGESGSDTKLSEHFLNWFAVIFQRKDKPITAWVVHGTEGTGKGFFVDKVATPLLGKLNVAVVGIDTIEDKFNEWQLNKLFINVNEVDADDFTAKGRVEAKFKMWITDKTMPVRRMRQTTSIERNWGSYLFSSNKKKPVVIPMDDRRYNVGNRQGVKLVPPAEEAVENELEAFAQWLLAHKADVKLANTVLHTEARSAMQRLGQNSIEETCQAIVDGDFDNFWINMIDEELLARGTNYNEQERIYNSLIKSIAAQIMNEGVRQTITRDEMGILLRRCVGNAVPLEPNKLTSMLRQNGIETKQVRRNNKKTYGIHVVWRISPEIIKEIEQELGAKPKLRRAK